MRGANICLCYSRLCVKCYQPSKKSACEVLRILPKVGGGCGAQAPRSQSCERAPQIWWRREWQHTVCSQSSTHCPQGWRTYPPQSWRSRTMSCECALTKLWARRGAYSGICLCEKKRQADAKLVQSIINLAKC